MLNFLSKQLQVFNFITTRQIDQTYSIYNIDQADQNFKFIRILTIIVNQKEPADKKSLLSKISDGKYNSSPKNISYKNISILKILMV